MYNEGNNLHWFYKKKKIGDSISSLSNLHLYIGNAMKKKIPTYLFRPPSDGGLLIPPWTFRYGFW